VSRVDVASVVLARPMREILPEMALAQNRPPSVEPGAPGWIDRFRIADCIAEGGMGRVFRAYDTAAGRTVAIKLTRTGTIPEIASLLREAAVLRRVQHPGIVRLLGDGTWNGAPWLALELLDGHTLADEMDASGHRGRPRTTQTDVGGRRSLELPTPAASLPAARSAHAPLLRDPRPIAAAGRLNEVAAIVAQMAMALDHLHSRGLVHRDLKPANVFLRPGDGTTRVTLLDFGLSCRANAARPVDRRSTQRVGTMQYAAPEQIRGEPVDARADIYSLGCILYELATGLRPFEGDSEHEVAQKHLHRDAIPPSELVWGLPWSVESLLMEMLAKKPGERPASAGAAGARLALAVRRAEGGRVVGPPLPIC
jgi:eukaryotic-like serine/threonine-protein kinase